MPCDSVAVMTVEDRKAKECEALALDVFWMLNEHQVTFNRQTQSKDMGKTVSAYWFFLLTNPLVSLVVTDGQIVCQTKDGTFEVGQVALMELLAKMRESGMEVEPSDIETHVHAKEGQAPQQAYGQTKQLN